MSKDTVAVRLDHAEQPEPDVDAVLQDDYQLVAVPVRQDGPWRVTELPTRESTSRYLVSSLTEVAELAAADPRRKYITIIAEEDVYLGHDKSLTQQGEVGLLPGGVPLTLGTADRVYVRGATVAGRVSWWSGQWAD